MDQDQTQSLSKLESKLKITQITFLVYATVSIASLVYFLFLNSKNNDIIHVKGIVIEDAMGRDRILIGAPIPYSKNRVRTDTAMVRKYWSKNYGQNAEQFMNWYQAYYHGAEGIVVLNEQGFDRVLLGDNLADPNSGKRMFQVAGMLWNDPQGWEMGGAGVNTSEDGKSRAVMGVDDRHGEAVHIVALEEGTKGLIIGGENGRMMVGMSEKNGAWFGNKEAFSGIKYMDNQGTTIWEQKMNQK